MFRWLKWLFELEDKKPILSPAESSARTAFRKDSPSELILNSRVLADESERFVVLIRYDDGRMVIPMPVKIYIVNKETGEAQFLSDDKAYRSKSPLK
jgi:hypothetical protein